MYNDIGEVSISFELCLTLVNIEPEQLQLINWFHEMIFLNTSQFTETLADTGCRVVLLSFCEPVYPLCLRKRPYSPDVTGIDYEEMRKIKKRGKNWTGDFTELEDSVVVAEYRPNNAPSVVVAVEYDLSTCSSFPGQSDPTYKSHFEKKD